MRQLLLRADLTTLPSGTARPDRFVYTVALDTWEVTVSEQELTPELHEVMRIVLGGNGGLDLG